MIVKTVMEPMEHNTALVLVSVSSLVAAVVLSVCGSQVTVSEVARSLATPAPPCTWLRASPRCRRANSLKLARSPFHSYVEGERS